MQQAKGFAPVAGVVLEVHLLHFHHQAAKIAGAQTLTVTEHPVILEDFTDQFATFGHKGTFIALAGIKPRYAVIVAGQQACMRAQPLAQ